MKNTNGEKEGGHRIFSWKIGVTKNDLENWVPQILPNIFVHWNCLNFISCATHVGGYMLFQHFSSWRGVIKMFDRQIGGSQKYCLGPTYFQIFMTPLFQRKWKPPYGILGILLSSPVCLVVKITEKSPFFILMCRAYLFFYGQIHSMINT